MENTVFFLPHVFSCDKGVNSMYRIFLKKIDFE